MASKGAEGASWLCFEKQYNHKIIHNQNKAIFRQNCKKRATVLPYRVIEHEASKLRISQTIHYDEMDRRVILIEEPENPKEFFSKSPTKPKRSTSHPQRELATEMTLRLVKKNLSLLEKRRQGERSRRVRNEQTRRSYRRYYYHYHQQRCQRRQSHRI